MAKSKYKFGTSEEFWEWFSNATLKSSNYGSGDGVGYEDSPLQKTANAKAKMSGGEQEKYYDFNPKMADNSKSGSMTFPQPGDDSGFSLPSLFSDNIEPAAPATKKVGKKPAPTGGFKFP